MPFARVGEFTHAFSGLAAPSKHTLAGERSGHCEDQFGMYDEFGQKRIWLNAADVERTTRLREEINY